MSAWPERRRAAPLHALLERASSFVLRPPEEPTGARLSLVPPPDERPAPDGSAPGPLRPVVAVVGLAPRAGASTLARALAGRLAGLDPEGAAILFTDDRRRGAPAGAAASRLAARLAEAGYLSVRAAGRLCVLHSGEPIPPVVARRDAPVVADVRHGAATEAAVAIADHVAIVCPPDVEPALAAAVETSLRGDGHSVSLVVSRATDTLPPELAHALTVPDSRLSAQLTLGCREPRGALAPVAAEIAERSLAEVIR